jgi:hypothetical protein
MNTKKNMNENKILNLQIRKLESDLEKIRVELLLIAELLNQIILDSRYKLYLNSDLGARK